MQMAKRIQLWLWWSNSKEQQQRLGLCWGSMTLYLCFLPPGYFCHLQLSASTKGTKYLMHPVERFNFIAYASQSSKFYAMQHSGFLPHTWDFMPPLSPGYWANIQAFVYVSKHLLGRSDPSHGGRTEAGKKRVRLIAVIEIAKDDLSPTLSIGVVWYNTM